MAFYICLISDGEDFTNQSGFIVFSHGPGGFPVIHCQCIVINITDDNILEDDESFTLSLHSPVALSPSSSHSRIIVSPSTTEIRIVDDEGIYYLCIYFQYL